MPEAALSTTFDQPSGVLTVAGEVDEESGEELRLAIEQHTAANAGGISVDLTGVTYLPSAGVAVLVRASQELATAGTPFELAAAAGSFAERVLTVCAMPHRAY